MKSTDSFSMVLVTAPDIKTARLLASAALKARLVACANLLSGVESHYWWKGKIERGSEILILFKTRKSQLASLEKLVLARHPYDTPEMIVVSPSAGTPKYLNWITMNLGPSGRRVAGRPACGPNLG
ncbi:MAG: divalent-cation tolerance protein CutA [Limisphaerales bacterium]